MSEAKKRQQNSNRLPVLLAAIGVGVILIASGVAVRSGQGAELLAAVNATQTTVATQPPANTPRPTATSTPDSTEIADTPTPEAVATTPPTPTPPPSEAATQPVEDTADATPLPTPVPIRSINTGDFASPSVPPATEVPPPAQLIPVPDGVINILALGSDQRPNDGGLLTDTIIVVSINTQERTVNMLSLPRDLLVYVPGWTMTKINRVYSHGQSVGWDGGGFGLLQETLAYNFGIQVGHYAMVDLSGFEDIVNILGGVEVPVDCELQFYALKEPRKRLEDFANYDAWVNYTAPDSGNWELVTLPVGVHELDGYMALRYARYRYGTTDFDRAYRQQQVLRAILDTARSSGFTNLTRVPQLWRQYNDLVQTSMDLGNMLEFARIATDLEGIQITSYVLTPDKLEAWNDPNLNQVSYYPNDEGYRFINQAMRPPSRNYVINNTVSVEVRNGTRFERIDEVAADRLIWNGIDAVATGPADAQTYSETVIYDFTGREKTSQLIMMQRQLHVNNANVITQPDPNRIFDYVVILGRDYSSCSRAPQEPQAPPPTPEPTETPTPPATPTPDSDDSDS